MRAFIIYTHACKASFALKEAFFVLFDPITAVQHKSAQIQQNAKSHKISYLQINCKKK